MPHNDNPIVLLEMIVNLSPMYPNYVQRRCLFVKTGKFCRSKLCFNNEASLENSLCQSS